MQERGTHPPFYRSRKGGKLVCRKNRSLFVGALIVLLGAILAALDRLLTSRGRFARALPGFDLMKQSSMFTALAPASGVPHAYHCNQLLHNTPTPNNTMKDQCKRTTISTIAAYLFIGSLICGIAPTVHAGAPGIDTRWDDTTLDQKALLGAAERAIKAAGFTESFQIGGQSVYAASGDYRAGIRCVASKQIVFFTVTGPDIKECQRLDAHLADSFH